VTVPVHEGGAGSDGPEPRVGSADGGEGQLGLAFHAAEEGREQGRGLEGRALAGDEDEVEGWFFVVVISVLGRGGGEGLEC